MAIGNESFWVLIRVSPAGVPESSAYCDPSDARQALKFRDAAAAYRFMDQHTLETPLGQYFPVKIPG